LVYIFHIADGDIRGKINVQPDSYNLVVDPSGLYFAVITSNQTVQMFEVGTGKRVYEFAPDFDSIGQFIFTKDGGSFAITDATRSNVKFY
jgi:hypothetical protein